MITKFDSLFAGHIDMDNVGYGGIPVNDRRFPNEHLATVFDKAQAMAQLMDRVGYNAFWMAEHHFQHEGYECIPNVLMTAVHLTHVTKRLKIGCGFNITPMWHPLRLAEDFATADILTDGRIIFGVGRGYHTREVETFGAPLLDQPANRELFEEQVDIIFKAFNEESFSHRGKHYTLPPEVPYRGYTLKELTVVPRPLRLPVECWQPVQGGTARALDFMAKHGIRGLIGGGSAEGGAMHKVVLGWQEAHARRGQHLEMGLSDEQIEIMRDPERAPTAKLPRIEDAIANGGVLCGSPEQVVEHLKALERRYPGLDRVSVSLSVGVPQEVCLEQLEWFASEVMPAFKQVKVAEPAMAN